MSIKKQIVIIDNHDSFTYNLFQIFDEHPACDIHVIQHDKVILSELVSFDQIVLSPGPDVPQSYPILTQIITKYKGVKPILGVCLGHQTIGEYFGAKLSNLAKVYHGQQLQLQIVQEDYLFKGIPNHSLVGLYHSWALEQENFPDSLSITALSSDNIIMAITHKVYNIKGIQFHPESFMTEKGREMIHNWIEQEKR